MPKGEYTDGKVKVTVRLDPALVKRAKIYAIEQQTTLQALIEVTLANGMRRAMRPPVRKRR